MPLTAPSRPAVCSHDVRAPFRQACCCCGACDHIDFRVTDEVWADVVPAPISGGHVCLRCFDAMAAETGIDYAQHLSRVDFVGDAASFELRPVSAVSIAV